MFKEIFRFIFVPKTKEELASGEALSEVVQVRVTPSQKQLLDKVCEWQKTNKSDFIRHIIFEKYINDVIKG
ncbi:MAG: hypothetical protein KH333_12080 [Clostridium sp.]|jgi:uncharacterized protein (DUF1778 family)|nr:hypothetical protein [Clostridium sp.]